MAHRVRHGHHGLGRLRSWTWSSYIASQQGADGTWRHFADEGWVMNNMVRFKACEQLTGAPAPHRGGGFFTR